MKISNETLKERMEECEWDSNTVRHAVMSFFDDNYVESEGLPWIQKILKSNKKNDKDWYKQQIEHSYDSDVLMNAAMHLYDENVFHRLLENSESPWEALINCCRKQLTYIENDKNIPKAPEKTWEIPLTIDELDFLQFVIMALDTDDTLKKESIENAHFCDDFSCCSMEDFRMFKGDKFDEFLHSLRGKLWCKYKELTKI